MLHIFNFPLLNFHFLRNENKLEKKKQFTLSDLWRQRNRPTPSQAVELKQRTYSPQTNLLLHAIPPSSFPVISLSRLQSQCAELAPLSRCRPALSSVFPCVVECRRMGHQPIHSPPSRARVHQLVRLLDGHKHSYLPSSALTNRSDKRVARCPDDV